MMKVMGKKTKIILISIVVTLIILPGVFYIYTLNYYRADDDALQVINNNSSDVKNHRNITVFYPDDKSEGTTTGLIFYPGGKVEDVAYAPILYDLSKRGITCILLKMPFNLAVFNIDAADSVYGEFPHIKNWYIAGHSLGGAMASSYVEDNGDKLNGMILLGAYPINDEDVPTLVIYGSEDLGLDLSKLENTENKIELSGGNHANFGNYGIQKGDGIAAMSRMEQQILTIDAIIEFIAVNNK